MVRTSDRKWRTAAPARHLGRGDVGITQAAYLQPANKGRTLQWRLTVADRVLAVFVVCSLIPLGTVIALWMTGSPVTDPATPFPYLLVLSFLCAVSIFDTRLRNRVTRLDRLQTNARLVSARLDPTLGGVSRKGDELDELTTSFDAITGRMQEQLRTLAAMNEIDRAVLSTLDSKEIVETVLTRTGDIAPCDAVVVALAPRQGRDEWTVRAKTVAGSLEVTASVEPDGWEMDELWSGGDGLVVDMRTGARSYLNLESLAVADIRHFRVIPFFREGAITGLMALGHRGRPSSTGHDQDQIRRLADQLTVALSNARLMEEVNDLNWGTVTALARTIDGCSPWTAGHSERVTRMGLAIGRELGLSDKKLDILHRGGLLHDIGKMGIDPSVLNKPARLDQNELEMMQQHPRLGAKILAPIPQYTDLVPIVLYHHERVDGGGYPDGLAGNSIPFLAWILAVADVFDALKSERPYRPALSEQVVLQEITKMSGTHLDPAPVEAFRAVHSRLHSGRAPDIVDLSFDVEAFYDYIE